MSESKLQTKIIKWLKQNGYWAFKVMVANRNGIPDIVGCTPKGAFFAIEVKYGDNKASELQKYNLNEVRTRQGIAILAYDLQTVIDALEGK